MRSNVSVVFSIFVFFLFLFEKYARCVHILDERCLPTAEHTKKREKNQVFFLRFKENLKCDWHRHRHIPSMEYFMQNANKTFETNTHTHVRIRRGFCWFNQWLFCEFFVHFSITSIACIDRCAAAVWLLMTFYRGLKAIQTVTMGHLALLTFTDTQSFQVNYLMLES